MHSPVWRRLEWAHVGTCPRVPTLPEWAICTPRHFPSPPPPLPAGVDTDELDSNVEDWEEETIEFFVTEEIIPLGNPE